MRAGQGSAGGDPVRAHGLGKVAFVALLGTVTLEVALVARYWTWLFGILTFLSYALVYPYLVVFPLAGERSGRGSSSASSMPIAVQWSTGPAVCHLPTCSPTRLLACR